MKVLNTLLLTTVFALLGNMALANCGHPHHERAFQRTLQDVSNTRSDYWKAEAIKGFASRNCFNTTKFIKLASYLRSDYYLFEVSKFAVNYVNTPLSFPDVVPMLGSRYYQRELENCIYNSPRYIKRNRNQQPRRVVHRGGGNKVVVVVKNRGRNHRHGHRHNHGNRRGYSRRP